MAGTRLLAETKLLAERLQSACILIFADVHEHAFHVFQVSQCQGV